MNAIQCDNSGWLINDSKANDIANSCTAKIIREINSLIPYIIEHLIRQLKNLTAGKALLVYDCSVIAQHFQELLFLLSAIFLIFHCRRVKFSNNLLQVFSRFKC